MRILTDAKKSGDQFHFDFHTIIIQGEIGLGYTFCKIFEVDSILERERLENEFSVIEILIVVHVLPHSGIKGQIFLMGKNYRDIHN